MNIDAPLKTGIYRSTSNHQIHEKFMHWIFDDYKKSVTVDFMCFLFKYASLKKKVFSKII